MWADLSTGGCSTVSKGAYEHREENCRGGIVLVTPVQHYKTATRTFTTIALKKTCNWCKTSRFKTYQYCGKSSSVTARACRAKASG